MCARYSYEGRKKIAKIMKPFIRRARHEDAKEIIECHIRSIREVCAKDYNEAQIAAWSGRDFQETRWHQTMNKDFVWVVADDSGKVHGFGHLEIAAKPPARIAGLYFAPEVIGKGLGREMITLMRDECRKKGISDVDLMSTKTSKEFYQKMGFSSLGLRVHQLGGQNIECYEMIAKI